MALNKFNRKYYSNIETKMPYVHTLKPEMIIKRELIGTKGKRDPQPVYDWKMNQEFWMKQKDPINVVLDEVHNMMDSRRSMSKANVIMGNFMALLRRVLGAQHGSYGELVLITQLLRRVDIIALELASEIRYHIMHYSKKCKDCGQEWRENTEMPEGYYRCIRCGSMNLLKFKHRAEIYRFRGMNEYQNWRDFQEKSWFHHYMINDIENYFGLYETLQWSNLFESVYG